MKEFRYKHDLIKFFANIKNNELMLDNYHLTCLFCLNTSKYTTPNLAKKTETVKSWTMMAESFYFWGSTGHLPA